MKSAHPNPSFGNSKYTIQFSQTTNTPIFGHRYTFTLEDAIDACPEYVINMKVLERLAKEYDLELVEKSNFHDIYEREIQPSNPSGNTPGRSLFYRMNVLDEEGTISEDEWEAIGIYIAFAFRKRGEPPTDDGPRSNTSTPHYRRDDRRDDYRNDYHSSSASKRRHGDHYDDTPRDSRRARRDY
ncbi:mRNA cap guanine-N7 methyltransferase [Quaeritorhiza haematococci]|nr:mRNA cap guanine-N7 methyltransferase [Quaeritorhiza haematococci]